MKIGWATCWILAQVILLCGCGEKNEEKTKQRRKDLKGLLDRVGQYQTLTEQAEEKKAAYVEIFHDYQEKRDEYEAMEQAFLDEQAGILAEARLTEGQPCPVCGSLSHPSPAKKSAKAPTEAQLKKAKKKAADAQRDAEKASGEGASAIPILASTSSARCMRRC